MNGGTAQRARMLKAADKAARFVLDPHDPAFVHLASARKYLRSLPAERRAELERDWREGRCADLNEPTSDSIKARAAAEWRIYTGEGIYD